MSKPILCLDFDGVLHSYTSGWKGASEVTDPPVPGAMRFLMEATRLFDVCVFSSRTHQSGGITAMKEAIKRWIVEDGWPDAVAEAMVEGPDAPIRFPTEKPSAKVTIDDRAICFTGTWPTFDELLNFQPWNKR